MSRQNHKLTMAWGSGEASKPRKERQRGFERRVEWMQRARREDKTRQDRTGQDRVQAYDLKKRVRRFTPASAETPLTRPPLGAPEMVAWVCPQLGLLQYTTTAVVHSYV